jgi:hypothetical protein
MKLSIRALLRAEMVLVGVVWEAWGAVWLLLLWLPAADCCPMVMPARLPPRHFTRHSESSPPHSAPFFTTLFQSNPFYFTHFHSTPFHFTRCHSAPSIPILLQASRQ